MGSKGGVVVRAVSSHLPPMWPVFDFQRRHHVWVEFVVSSLLCPLVFFFDTPVFHSPETNTSKCQFDFKVIP